MEGITHVGLDVHAETIVATVLRPGHERPLEMSLVNNKREVERFAKQLKKLDGGPIRACYEAGPTGYQLLRWLEEAGIACDVVAPSLIPVKPGERIKTDRRDAQKLATMLRAGMLTMVRPPTPAQEAARELTRRLQSAKSDRQRDRNRLGKFLLLRGVRYPKRTWTKAHWAWLWSLHMPDPTDDVVLDDSKQALMQVDDRVRQLQEHVEKLAETEAYREKVGQLRCVKGIDTMSAMVLLTELHGIERFRTPRELMSYLGLVPSEHSSGPRERRGRITKAGNLRARTVLVEVAWHARHGVKPSPTLRARRRDKPAWAVAVAEKAERRLSKRHRALVQRGKESNKVTVAVARELTGFVWDILTWEARHRTTTTS